MSMARLDVEAGCRADLAAAGIWAAVVLTAGQCAAGGMRKQAAVVLSSSVAGRDWAAAFVGRQQRVRFAAPVLSEVPTRAAACHLGAAHLNGRHSGQAVDSLATGGPSAADAVTSSAA